MSDPIVITTPEAGALAPLSPAMQQLVDRTLAADRKGGEALWEKALAVADARAQAQHGEWGSFLLATGQEERAARRLIDIAERGRGEPRFRDMVITGWLSFSVAAIVAKADEELLSRLLEAPAAPTRREVLALANPAPVPDLEAERPEVIARADAIAAAEGRTRQERDIITAKAQISDVLRRAKALGAQLGPAGEEGRWAIFWPGRTVGINTSWDNLLYSLEQKEQQRRTEVAGPTSKYPIDWDRARERAAAVGARLWYNESDGTYTLSERAGHVPRTSSWAELRMWLEALERKHRPAAEAATEASRWHVDSSGKEWPGVPDRAPAPWKADDDEGDEDPLQHDADRLTELAARALRQGYLLRPHGAALRITRRTDGQPFGGAKNLDEAEAIILQWEREAGLSAPRPAPAPLTPADAFDAEDRALADRAISQVKRILRRLSEPELLLVAKLFGDAERAEQALRGPAAAWAAINELIQHTAHYAADDPELPALLDRLEGRPAPAAAAPDHGAALPDLAGDEPIPFASLVNWCDELERRWANEGMSVADERTVELISDHLAELVDDESVDDLTYELLETRVNQMADRLAAFASGEDDEPVRGAA